MSDLDHSTEATGTLPPYLEGLVPPVSVEEALDYAEERGAPEAALRFMEYFDRAYLPNGMWNTLISTTSGIVTGQTTVGSAVKQVEAEFGTLYGQQ